MLTDRQRERCRELARALDSGDYATYKRAEAALTPEMRGEIWDQRAHVKTQTARAAKAGEVSASSSPKPPRPARIEASLDLDYWADDISPDPDDGDGDTDQTTKLCSVCQGKGRDHSGDTCEECGGSGRIPIDPDEENDDGEDG